MLTKEKQGNNNNNNKIKTFAEIAANIKSKSKRIPKLIIEKTNNKDTTDIEKIVIQQLTLNKTIQTKSVACIMCTETWNLEHYEYFNIPGYNRYYNNSKINI